MACQGKAKRNALQAFIALKVTNAPDKANKELEQIAPIICTHPQVLRVRYFVYSAAERWEICVEIARALVELVPGEAFGWVSYSHALRRALDGRVQAAYDALLPAADRVKDLEQVTFVPMVMAVTSKS